MAVRKINENFNIYTDEMDEFNIDDLPMIPDTTQMDEIRKVSNIIQALENLMGQCQGYQPLNHITEFARQSLLYSHQQLRRLIHQ